MIEGLWSISFASVEQPETQVGAGVVVFETLRIFGGDSLYFYIGNYSISNGNISAEARVNHYFGPPSSIFGTLEQYTVVFSGPIAPNEFYVGGYVKENPAMKLVVKLVKRAELP